MFRLDHTLPDNAEGKIAEIYQTFPPQVPVPEPMIMMSASPGLAEITASSIKYYMGHDRMDMGLTACIRFLVAREFGYSFCIEFNRGLLKNMGGLSDEQLDAMAADPDKTPLEESQVALVKFVLKVVKTPEAVTDADIAELRDLGWRDSDILDAAWHGASMFAPASLYKALRK
ncbi:MAG: hypothetical protein D6E12_12335 [Desulfovibrio sp.]|nr:MAG: hypothetical protein D6E12_12335 [Desulfovibrio sp.]